MDRQVEDPLPVGLDGATGTYSISVDADRGFGFDASTDDLNDNDANYVDTKDRTAPDTTIGDWGTSVLRVCNQFGKPLTATELRVTDVTPVNASADGTTTNSTAVVVNEDSFSVGRTVDARHGITVSVVEGGDSGAGISLGRTVTANVRCN